MTLDVRTIVVMLLLSSVLMTVTLAVGMRSSRGGGLAKWNLGLGLFALAWLLMASRNHLPDVLTLALADALLLAGLCVQFAAVTEFGGATAPRWLLYLPGTALFFIVLPLMQSYAAFTLTVSVSFAAGLVAIAIRVHRVGVGGGPARWMLSLPYGAGALVLMARAVVMMVEPESHTGLFAGNAIHAVAFLALFAMIGSGSLAFLLMLKERAETEIRRIAMFDPLTELFNRRAFMDLAERELSRARRTGRPLAVLMLDLDYFKKVNDEYGHQAGDRVLAEFSAIVKRGVRTEDLVGRYGGEEFCAMLPDADLRKAVDTADRIRTAVRARPLAGLPLPVTVSIGAISIDPKFPCTLDAAIAAADKALYQAKKDGRDRVVGLGPASVQPDHPADIAEELSRADAVGPQFVGRPVEQPVH
jgi:diguanylate cyclase (GGDEF)-like protein